MQKIVSLENVTHFCWKWKASGTITLLWGLSYCCSSNAWRFSIRTPYWIKARQTKVSLSLMQIFFWVVKTFWKSVRLCSLIKSLSRSYSVMRSQKQCIVSPWWSHTQWTQGWKSIKSATQTQSITMETSVLTFLHAQTNRFTWSFSLFS